MAAHDDNSTEPTVLSHAIPALELISGGMQRRRASHIHAERHQHNSQVSCPGEIGLADSRSDRLDECERPSKMLPAKDKVAKASCTANQRAKSRRLFARCRLLRSEAQGC